MSPQARRPLQARRYKSRQRDALLARLRASEAHPTAAELHALVQRDFPQLSLGTVYRNLDVLVGEGLIEAVPSEQGPMRYDGNPDPHHHFICEHCGAILDVELDLPAALTGRLRRDYALEPARTRVQFFGLCPDCGDADSSKSTSNP